MNYLKTEEGKRIFKAFLKKFNGKASQKAYRSEVNRFLEWAGVNSLEGITRKTLRDYDQHLAHANTAKTIKRKFSMINQFLKFAEKRVKGFPSPVGKVRGDVQALHTASYCESDTFQNNLIHFTEILKTAGTATIYSFHIRSFFQWAKVSPADLSSDDFRRYRDYLVKERRLKPSTVWNKLVAINRFFTFLSEKSRNFRNPLDISSLDLDRPPKDAGYNNVLTAKEVEALCGVPDRRTLIGKRDYLILRLMAIFGLRENEVVRLRWRDIEPDRVQGQQKVWIRDRKGRAGMRPTTAIILNGPVLAAWDDWLNNCNIPYEPDTPFFIGFRYDRSRGCLALNQAQIREKRPLTPDAIQELFIKYMARTSIVPGQRVVSPHALRHTAITDMHLKKMPLPKIKYLAGHRDVNTTMIYSHHQEDYDDNLAMHSEFNK